MIGTTRATFSARSVGAASSPAASASAAGAAASARLPKSGPVAPEVSGGRKASAPVRGMLAPGSRRGRRLPSGGRSGVGSDEEAAAAGAAGAASGWVDASSAAVVVPVAAGCGSRSASALAALALALASEAAARSAALASAFSARARLRASRLETTGAAAVAPASSAEPVDVADAVDGADGADVVVAAGATGAPDCDTSGSTDGGSRTLAVMPPPGLRARWAVMSWRSARRDTTNRPMRRAVSGVASAPCWRSPLSCSSSAGGTPRPESVIVMVTPSGPCLAARRTGSDGGEKLSALSTSSVSRWTTSAAASSPTRVLRLERICTRW